MRDKDFHAVTLRSSAHKGADVYTVVLLFVQNF